MFLCVPYTRGLFFSSYVGWEYSRSVCSFLCARLWNIGGSLENGNCGRVVRVKLFRSVEVNSLFLSLFSLKR